MFPNSELVQSREPKILQSFGSALPLQVNVVVVTDIVDVVSVAVVLLSVTDVVVVVDAVPVVVVVEIVVVVVLVLVLVVVDDVGSHTPQRIGHVN